MPRVAGVDPGSVSFDLCVLQDGQPVLEQVFETGSLRHDPRPLLDALRRHGPYDLVYGPSGYGVPLVAAADIDELRLAEMVLVRPDERGAAIGIGGMRTLMRGLARSGMPVVFGPGVIHLPSVPRHRKYNRIDLGTADKVCSVAYAIVDQASLWDEPAFAEGWAALLEGTAKAVRGLSGSVPAVGEVVVSGRVARIEGAVASLAALLADVAPVRALVAGPASTAAHGGALLADGLAGGRHQAVVAALGLREAAGTVLDHLRVAGADTIRLG